MKDYLQKTVDTNDPEFVSVIDELSLWAAPFGLRLLETITMRRNIQVLDIGPGLGFPLIEIAERLGSSSMVYGIDPWERAVERARLKANVHKLRTVEVLVGEAEHLPFEKERFDLVVSNNGINNVRDMDQVFRECKRVCKAGAQLVFTLNLEETMKEFYALLQRTLEERHLDDALPAMRAHIHTKRRPMPELTHALTDAGFTVSRILYDAFKLRFADGTAMFTHHLINYWFLGAWKEFLPPDDCEAILDQMESTLNAQAQTEGEVVLTIPFATIDCRRR